MIECHEIDQTTGEAAIFVTGQPAWHKLGTVVKTAQTSEEAIRLAKLNWNVEQWAVTAHSFKEVDGVLQKKTIDVPDKYTLVRSDTESPLATLSTSYVPFQNHEAFEFFDDIVAEKLAMYETAGSLKGGRIVWILARLPQELRTAGDDVTHPYVLLTNSHDGTRCLRMIPTSIRVVCWNTYNIALSKGKDQGIGLMHTGKLSEKVDQARNSLGLITERFGDYQTEMQAMVGKDLQRSKLIEYLADLAVEFRSSEESQKRMVENLKKNLKHPTNQVAGMEGTVWQAFNAVSYFADHQIMVRGKGSAKNENRLNSIWFGSSNTLKQAAYQKALQLVG